MLWIKTLSARTAKPFLAALPAYSVRVGRDSNGTIVAVESEVPFLAGGSVSDELMAQPQQVAELLGNLTRQRPAHLAGVIWFRLPTTNDQRAWSPATLRAVITGKPLTTDLTPVLTAGATPGLTIIALANNGSTDAALPQRVTLPAACQLADGAEDYRFDAPALLRNENGILHEHGQTIIGWARCALQPQDIHVQP